MTDLDRDAEIARLRAQLTALSTARDEAERQRNAAADEVLVLSERALDAEFTAQGAEAARDAALQTCAWQPISTAPKDGTVILVYVVGDAQYVVWWLFGDWVFFQAKKGNYSVAEPTHWRQLPLPPEAGDR